MATFSLLLLLLKIRGAILNIFSGGSYRTLTFLQSGEYNMALIAHRLCGTAKAFRE